MPERYAKSARRGERAASTIFQEKGERFGLHGLKHRGVTDSKGDKQEASGHKTRAMMEHYNHELPG